MTAAELVALVAAVTPGVVAWARTYRQTDQVRRLEASRQPNGERFGTIESKVDKLEGRVLELSLMVHGRAAAEAEGRPPPRPPRPMGEPVTR